MGARKATLVFAFAFAALVAVFQHSQGQPLQGGGPPQGQPPQNNNGTDGVVAQPPQGQPLQNNNGTDGVVAQPPQGQPLQNNNGTDGVVAQPGSGGCTSNGPQPQGNAPANQPINVTFAPDLASRPAINFMLRLGGVALVNNESYVKQFDYDMKVRDHWNEPSQRRLPDALTVPSDQCLCVWLWLRSMCSWNTCTRSVL